MSADLIPFPIVRRLDLVKRQAFYMACRSAPEAEKYLRRQLDVQRNHLGKKGVPVERIEAAVLAYEGAIRAALWRLVMQGQDGGGDAA